MAIGTSHASALLNLLLNNTAVAGLGDATGIVGSTADGSLYLALHTASPGTGGQSNNECAYGSYARVAITRDGTGWLVVGANATNLLEVAWPECTSGSETATHWSLGIASSGATQQITSGALTSSLAITSGVVPTAAVGELDVALT